MEKTAEIPVGVVVRRSPGSTRWAKWVWRAVAVMPGAAPASWRVLRREGEAVEYHAATVTLLVHRAETEAYRAALASEPPCVWAILRPDEDEDDHAAAAPGGADERPGLVVHSVTASPYDAQDYLDSGEEIVEAIPAPPGLVAWLRDFVDRHHVDEPFKKRRRDRLDVERVEDGVGDPRVRQAADVYRAPAALKPKRTLQ
ncbi:MAG: DUF3305 domain-containing protein [Pseudomonadota bacterium]